MISSDAILVELLVAGIFGHILFRDTWDALAMLAAAMDKSKPLGEEIV